MVAIGTLRIVPLNSLGLHPCKHHVPHFGITLPSSQFEQHVYHFEAACQGTSYWKVRTLFATWPTNCAVTRESQYFPRSRNSLQTERMGTPIREHLLD
ncbi:hypothetical protein OPQ81_000316 [Rhizoctonia solani]|nr:hypothetical protein OPQ81_000316 [Rhizoctonia solani]